MSSAGSRPSLLLSLQSLLERTYRMETGIADLSRFVIGDAGYRLYYSAKSPRTTVASALPAGLLVSLGAAKRGGPRSKRAALPASGASEHHGGAAAPGSGHSEGARPQGGGEPAPVGASALVHSEQGPVRAHAIVRGEHGPVGARVLVHDGPGPIRAHLYYPDALIRNLEAHPPLRGIGDVNIDDFATFIEELDHFLLLAERARLRKPVSLLELELHANVSKFLVCALFLAARGGRGRKAPLETASRVWLLWHLFEKAEFAEADPQVRSRYREASRFARRFIDRLDRESDPRARLTRLRAFHDATHQQKISLIA